MNKLPKRVVLALLSALTAASGSAYGQAVASPGASSPSEPPAGGPGVVTSQDFEDPEEEETVILDPFTVTAEIEGYQATDTLGGARTRTKLIDTPSAVSVITPKLMQDLGVTKSEDLLRYTTATETGGFYGNYSGMTSRGAGVTGAAEGERLANPQALNRARGIGALDNTRNYLLSSIPWDGYNISRVEIARGPNSFLFGVGAPSGISNVMTNNASYRDSGSVEGRYGSYGSTRVSLDGNKVIVPGELAVRIDLVNDHAKYEQKPAYNHSKRAYGAVLWEPKFLDTPFAHTKIQANFERGEVRSNNPRTLPPMDFITGYLKDPRMSSTGYDLWTYTPSSDLFNTDPNASFYSSNGSWGNWNQWGSGPQFYWDAESGQLIGAGQPNFSSPRGNGYGEPVNRYHVYTRGYNNYAKNMNGAYRRDHGGADGGEFAGAAGGSVTYFDQTFSDHNIFNFYKKLIDGENKKEWQDWDTTTLNIVQTLFDNKLSLQALASRENYSRGQEGMMMNGPVLMLDLDRYLSTYPSWLPQAMPNPNLGRPVVVGPYGGGDRRWTERENFQLTAAYDLDLEDMFANESLLSRILGRHQFTGLVSRSTATDRDVGYKLAAMDQTYSATYADSDRPGDNSLNWQAYLGPTMLGRSDAGPKLSNLATKLPANTFQLNSLGGMQVYDNTWTAAAGVNEDDAWLMPGPNGTVVARTQADNPANYRGYTRVPASVITSATNMDELRTRSSMKEQRIDSQALMYQGHFWDDTIIPSFGYRQDKTLQRGNTAHQNDLDGDGVNDTTTGFYREVKKITDPGISATTHSTSYGVAVHLPKFLKQKLSEGTDLSFYYFHGSNETPKIRYAIDGTQLPNEEGETNDYSVQFDYRGKLTVRLTRFDTVSKYSQASYGSPLGGNGWFIGAAPNWALTMGAAAMAAYEMPDEQLPAGLRANSWFYNWARDPARAELMPRIGQALREDFTAYFDQAYWDRYGSNVDVAAIQRGDWLHILKDTDVALPWTIVGIGDSIHGVQEIIDQDVGSKGYELEVTYRPRSNWDITFNVAKVNATQIKLGDAATRHLTAMKHIFVDTAFGDVAMWGGYNTAGAWRSEFMKNLWAPYNVQIALTGSDQPEVREWRFNGVTNYRFDHGFLRGLNIGGAFRWEDKPTLGFGIHESDIGEGQTLWISDVNQRLQGKADEHFDLWVGYERKLTDKINWRMQVNVRNVGENTKLVPIALQPNGDVAQSRIQSGQSMDLTMKFSF